MRQVKTLVRVYGALKRAHPSEDESKLLRRSFDKVILSILVKSDVEKWDKIMKDSGLPDEEKTDDIEKFI